MRSIRDFLNLLTLTIIALGCSMLFAAATNAQTVVRNGAAVMNGETAPCYTITTNPPKTTCAPVDYWTGDFDKKTDEVKYYPLTADLGTATQRWAIPDDYVIESPQEIESRKAKWRGITEKIRRIYGREAQTPKHENLTVYDVNGETFQVFLGGFRDFGDPAGDAATEYGKETAPASPICGRETYRGSLRILITCPDWPAMRRATGVTMFPNEKGVQVFVRSSDPQTAAFEITIRYRRNGSEVSKTEFAAPDPKYDSGAGWLIGEAELLSVDVSELRRSASISLP